MNKILLNSLLKVNVKHILFNNINKSIYKNSLRVSVYPLVSEYISIQYRFAGHSKWQNIRHIKSANDSQKSKVYNRLIKLIQTAVRKPGGTDPKVNREYGDVLEMCRRANMPNTTFDKAVKRALNKKSYLIKLEVIGPNGCLLIIEGECESNSNLRYLVKGVLKKYIGFGFADEGRALFAFQEKSVIRVKNIDKNGNKVDFNNAEEIGIEADAEEVKINSEDDCIEFIGEPLNCHKTKNYIEEKTALEVIEFGIELIPHMRVELPEHVLQIVSNAIEELEEIEEINRIYDNIN